MTASTTQITSFTVDWVNIRKYALIFSITGTHFAIYYSITSMLCCALHGLSSGIIYNVFFFNYIRGKEQFMTRMGPLRNSSDSKMASSV